MNKTKPAANYLNRLRQRYAQASKKERSGILDEFVKTSGYHRKHAIALLRGKRSHRISPARRPRAKIYTSEDARAVLGLAEVFDQISSERLRAALAVTLPELRQQGHLRVSATCYQHLLVISPSTMDRIRAAAKRPGQRRKGFTKPGTLLKHQIPVRTFADWTDTRPGFVEIDLVDHSGGKIGGDFAHTLNLTDVCTGWTEMLAVPTKAQRLVLEALQTFRQRYPVPLLGIDSDNGSEFINAHLLHYCQQERITFTRGRVGRKNDNPFVEQKNWSVVRRLVGYLRYDQPRQVAQLNRLYDYYRLYVNFFLPVTKLQQKVRVGSRVKKVYDPPQTPYARLLASAQVSEPDKSSLQATYSRLDVVVLKQEIDAALDTLLALRPK